MLNNISDTMAKILAPFAKSAYKSLDSYINIETAENEKTLAASDGSLVTILRIDGARTVVGQSEFGRIVDQANVKLGSRFDRPGHALQCVFIRNPDRIRQELHRTIRPNRRAARNMGLDLKDLFDERERHLAKFLSHEECYFVLWTRAGTLTASEEKRAKKRRENTEWVFAPRAQFPLAGLEELRTRHKGFVNGIHSALDDLNIVNSVLNSHDAITAIRNSIYPGQAHEDWKPLLPGDKIPPRAPQSAKDLSDILWPTLRHQICTYDAKVIDSQTVRIGNRIWSGADMTLPPSEALPFTQLMNRYVETNIPFRLSILIESGGVEGMAMRKMLASILGFSNSTNIKIKNSIEALTELSQSEPVVKMRVNVATWAPHDDREKLDSRVASMIQGMESWGYCQVTQAVGDPLSSVMSSALGVSCSSTAPPAIAPLREVVKLLPWQRSSSPFEEAAMILRTPDGQIWPYQTGSNLTTTWFDLIFAQPGAGKSVLMNSLNLSTCLTAGSEELPYIAVIDIGPSSAGLISLIKDALPPSRQHEANYYRLAMTEDYAINPFDTQLGCREPLPDERSYLIELLTLLCTPPGQARPYDGIPQLAGLVVDEMFRWRNDSEANAEARPYLPRVDEEVDEILSKHNVHLPDEPVWWEVVDALFEAGLEHGAMLAQRHAVPTLGDAVTAVRRQQIQDLLEDTQIGGSSEKVISAFERMVTSAVREFPILASITKFDITDSHICSLDLMDVCPQGDETADRQTAIMYMLARHALVRNWWINEDSIKFMPKEYRAYHQRRLKNIKESPKRLCYDEFHRTSKSKSVRSQIIRDVREGRKWGVQIVLSSQLLKDFDDDMVDLATGVWILGAAISDDAVAEAARRFSLSDTAEWIMRNRLSGPTSRGGPALFVLGTNKGRYEQHLINTLGPIELWALTTSAEDVAIRQRLYTRIGAGRARKVLAIKYPGGSARSDIRRRINAKTEAGHVEEATTGFVVEEIVEECIDMATEMTLKEISD